MQQHHAEGALLQGPCMVLLRPSSLQKLDSTPVWVSFVGQVEGVAKESRAQVRYFYILQSPRDNGAGRISPAWIKDFLRGDHEDKAAEGISLLVSNLTEDQALALKEWDGKPTDGDDPPADQEIKRWKQDAAWEFLPHVDAYIRLPKAREVEDFMTPPRPSKKTTNPEEEYWPEVPEFPESDEADPDTRLNAAREALRGQTQGCINQESLQTVATAFEVDQDQLLVLRSHIPSNP